MVVVSGENSRKGMSVPQSRRRFHAAMQPRWAFPEPHIFCHGLGERDDTFGVYFVAPKTRGDPCSRTGDDIRERPRPEGILPRKVSVALSDGSGVHHQKA